MFPFLALAGLLLGQPPVSPPTPPRPIAVAPPDPIAPRPPAPAAEPAPATLTRFDLSAEPNGFVNLFHAYGPQSRDRTAGLDGADGAGIVISLPPRAEGGHTGMQTDLPIVGDFQVETSYQIVRGPKRVEDGSWLSFGIWLDGPPGVGYATVKRGLYNGIVNAYRAERMFVLGKREAWATTKQPTTATTGRIGLRRVGTDLGFLAADGPAGELREFRRYPYGDKPILRLNFMAETSGGATAGLQVRFFDAKLRTGASLPPEPGKATQPVIEEDPMPDLPQPPAAAASDPADEPAPTPAPVRRAWLMWPVGVVGAFLLGLAVGRRTARGRSTEA